EFLVDKVINMMLDKLAKKDSEPQLDQWQHEVVKILSFSAKILKTNKLRSYQLLRICNDIVSSKLIQLPNIKEIIKLGLASDKQTVLSKKFVDHVLGILSKLKKSEQNLSLQRSFIMRCLDTIPLDSVVRQHIYNNIFSQNDSFPLMGSIITKIFWKEEETINDPFLRILIDLRDVLQASPRLKVVGTMNNLSNGYKQTVGRILSNNQSLLRLDNTIDNSNLYLKSVIAHIIAMHASIPPDSTPLATYFHKIEACQNMFILTTVSDIESLILSAVITGDQPGYIGEQVNNAVDHSVRSMPPSSYRILHLIVHALIGSSAHSQATLNFLRRHNQTANDTEQYCLAHIITDWTVLRQILDCSDENLALLFHSLLTTMTQTPLPPSNFRTPAEREDWETQFTRNYVSPLIRSVTETVTNFRTALDAAAEGQGNNANIIESEIDQTRAIDDEYRLSKLPRLW
ncbi:22494_t:CDS:2, partial [Dentiscutata erythropus]